MLFDLGVRKDWENYSPSMVSLIQSISEVRSPTNISEILDANSKSTGITSRDIEAVIWSHQHFDHIGDVTTFPPSTELVVGPGVRDLCVPGYPTKPDAMMLEADLTGRCVREASFDQECLWIGRFKAYDFFGDGSFYLLDAPGHCPGHLCGFARVTSSEDSTSSSFIFMGADACHHAGILRPTKNHPLPSSFPVDIMRIHREIRPNSLHEPFFVQSQKLFPHYEQAVETVRNIQDLDALENVFVILAHDGSLQEHLTFFPERINDWEVNGVKDRTRWLFCENLARAIGNAKSQ